MTSWSATRSGDGLDYRDVGEGFRQAVKRAGLQTPGKLTLHSLRHGFASLLIANGLNLCLRQPPARPRQPDWSRANERELAPTTARMALIALNQVCRYAVRRGWLADDPVAKLEPAEKPRRTAGQVSILEGHDLARLLDHACSYRPLFELLAYTGLRIGEGLGLTWADIDYEAGLIRIHRQLSRQRIHAPLKTEAAKREVILAPAIAKLLRERRLATLHKAANDLVFTTASGRGLDYRYVGHGFRDAVKRAGLQAPGRLSLHSLRHGFASLLIAEGMNVVFVSRQLGHANPTITLGVYAHLFERADHADAAREALETSYAATVVPERRRLW